MRPPSTNRSASHHGERGGLWAVWKRTAALLFVSLLCAAVAACSKNPENLILVSIDTLNRSALRAWSEEAPELPALDQFSRKAMVFTNAYSSSSWTLPAHASIMTGLYSDRHGATDWERNIAAEVPTLAEKLRQAGYETVAFTDGVSVSGAFGFSRGFDRYDDWIDPGASWRNIEIPRGGAPHPIPGSSLFDRGISYLRGGTGKKRPFLLFLHTYVVHDYFKRHSWAVQSLPPYRDPETTYYRDCITGARTCSSGDWDRLRALYRAELSRMDSGFGALLATLEELDLRRSTTIVFLSDHGEGFAPLRQRIHHGGRLHEDLIRIPLMVSGPGVRAGIADTPISLVDLLPTVLELLDLPALPGLDGRSFTPALSGGEGMEPGVFFAHEYFHLWRGGQRFEAAVPQPTPLSVAVIRGSAWYIREGRSEEFYDLRRDPDQKRNLAGGPSFPEEFRRLADRRRGFQVTVPVETRDDALKEKLRSLGYLK